MGIESDFRVPKLVLVETRLAPSYSAAETRQAASLQKSDGCLEAGHRHFRGAQFLLNRTIAGHRELENGTMIFGTVASLRLDPDLPAIALNDLLADCQTNSIARVFGPGVQA